MNDTFESAFRLACTSATEGTPPYPVIGAVPFKGKVMLRIDAVVVLVRSLVDRNAEV